MKNMTGVETNCSNEKKLKRPQSVVDDENSKDIKKPKLFSAKEFRNKLNTVDKLTALVEFYKLCDGDQGECAIKEYLDKGGNILELLQILEFDSESPHVLILNIVYFILLQITYNYPSYREQNLAACRYFLNTKLPLANKMLSLGSTSQERKTILKLLTAFVTFSCSQLGKEILQNVNLSPTNLELLTKQTGQKDGVRDVFLKFVVAFLLEGNFPLISLLLEKKGLLFNVVNGLIYDDAETVCIILMALKNHVLENSLVSKTLKMKIFNTPVVKEIVNLYNWRGLENFNSNPKKKKTVEINESDKSKVSENLHNFLLTLCTSHRFGVIFSDHSVGLNKTCANNLILSVLLRLESPWKHSFARDLVLKICHSCPDLVKTVWNMLKNELEPRDSDNWKKVMKFACDLLDELDPECVRYCYSELSFSQKVQIIQMLVSPLIILKTILPENGFESKNVEYNVYNFINKSLKKVKLYIKFSENYFKMEEFSNFERILSDYILKNYPNYGNVLLCLTENKKELEEEDYFSYLKTVMEILENYEKLCLSDFQYEMNSDFSISLENFYKTLNVIENKNNLDKIEELKVKFLKLFFNFDQTFFKMTSKYFVRILTTLILYYRRNRDRSTYETLEKIFLLSDVFIGKSYEVRIWIESIFYDESFKDSVAVLLARSLKIAEENLETYMKRLSEKQIKNEIADLENIINNSMTTETEVIPEKTPSPFVLGVIDYLKSIDEIKPLKEYLNYSLINLLHSQTNTNLLIENVLGNEKVPKIVTKYFQSWKKKKDIYISKNAKGFLGILSNFWTCNDLNDYVEKLNNKPNLRKFILNMCLFYITNLTKFEILNEDYVIKTVEFIKNCPRDDHFSWTHTIFTNRLLIDYFTFSKKKNNESSEFCTKFIYEVVDVVKNNDGENRLDSILKPFRIKLIIHLKQILEKRDKIETDAVLDCTRKFGLNKNDYKDILNRCLEIENNCYIGNLFLYNLLIICLDSFDNILDKTSIEKLSEKLEFLNVNNSKTGELSLSFNNYLLKFPHNFQNIGNGLFVSLLKAEEFCREGARLAADILERRKDFLDVLSENLQKRGLILSLLKPCIDLRADDNILQDIYLKIEPFVFKITEKPQKSTQNFEDNIDSVVYLIENFMDESFCKKFYEKIRKSGNVGSFYFKILSAIFVRSINVVKRTETINYIITSVHFINSFIKNNSLTEEKTWHEIKKLMDNFNGILYRIKSKNLEIDSDTICGNDAFKFYSRFSLKHGIPKRSFLLKNLNVFVDTFGEIQLEDAKMLLEMTTAHSEFLDAILQENQDVKEELISLIYKIFNTKSELIEKNYLPVVLSAYGATCRTSDKLILNLLVLLEKHGEKSDFYRYKPFLFGSAACAHYSVRQSIESALWRQPRISDVLDLLDEKLVESTIENVPLGTTQSNLKNSTYDMSFFLPLFSSLLSEENVVPTYKFVKKGALSLTVICLSSEIRDIRMAACYVIYRFYCHLESKPENKNKILWLRYCEAICRATAILNDEKLNTFSAIFFAKMALILTMPHHSLYLSMANYLTSKITPDLSGIPELYTFLHDPNVNYVEHQIFILKLLQNGLKKKSDFDVFLKTFALKLIQELYDSCTSSNEIKFEILNVIRNACKIQNGGLMLSCNYGLISWLHYLIKKLTIEDYELINVIINILSSLSSNYFMIHLTLRSLIKLKLIPCLTSESLELFLNIINKCVEEKCEISKDEVQYLIDYINDDFSNYLLECGKFIVCLKDCRSDNQVVFLLRKLILKCIDLF